MSVRRILLCALLCSCALPAASRAQDSSSGAVSSDDIRVADGLQLPSYGHVWLLDTWQGVKELVEMHPDASSGHGISLRPRHTIELKGESATLRSHDTAPQIFVRGVSGDDSGRVRAQFALLRMEAEDGRRRVPKDSFEELAAIAKNKGGPSPDVIEPRQERIGDTDWYRLSFSQPLAAGEYALVSLPGTPAAALNEIYDFAVDPQAPENLQPVRSERDRRSGQ